MRIVQLSDLHLSESPLYGVVDTLGALDLALRRILASPFPALLLISGDLVSAGRPEEYRLLGERLAGLPFPVALLPGNHDERAALRAMFPAQDWEAPPLCCRRVVVDGGCLLLVDTVVPGEEWGEIGDAQTDWLDDACPKDGPALLILHHPPFAVGIPGMDAIRCRGEARLARWLAHHEGIEALLCGHVHRFVCTTFAGRPALTAPSPAHQIALQDGPLAFTLEPGGYLVHDWSPGERLLTHYVPSQQGRTEAYAE